jgi:hypothetical protein
METNLKNKFLDVLNLPSTETPPIGFDDLEIL